MPDDTTLLVVGLGNPGEKYEKTRHNAGFLALDYFAGKNSLEIGTEKMQGLFCSARMAGRKVLLLKPLTFMNRSGDCVLSFVKYFDVVPESILVVHDDLDLDVGRVKMVESGGAGGHNGVRSLIAQLDTNFFPRLKIGIGHPRNQEETKHVPVEKYVLSGFSSEQWKVFHGNLDHVAAAIALFVEDGVKSAMNTVNQQPKQVT